MSLEKKSVVIWSNIAIQSNDDTIKQIYFGVIYAQNVSGSTVTTAFTEVAGRHESEEAARESFYQKALDRYPKSQGYSGHIASASMIPANWIVETANGYHYDVLKKSVSERGREIFNKPGEREMDLAVLVAENESLRNEVAKLRQLEEMRAKSGAMDGVTLELNVLRSDYEATCSKLLAKDEVKDAAEKG